MTRVSVLTASGLVCAAALLAAQNPPATSSQQPAFRAGVDLVSLDVSVLDKNRKPVRGLTQADFTLLEDGKPQSVETFAAIDLPDTVTTSTTWANQVTPDVTTNEIDNHRIILLVLDDAMGAGDLWGAQKVRDSANSIIAHMGPNDLATVVFTRDNRGAQGLTRDHRKLTNAVNKFGNLNTQPPAGPDCTAPLNTLSVLQTAADYLADVPQRRKTVIYLGANIPFISLALRVSGKDPCSIYPGWLTVFENAQRANVNIYPIDVLGLRARPNGEFLDWYLTVGEQTGGKAIINTNDFEPGIQQIFRENSSYYLLGYGPRGVSPDGAIRRIDVKVNRPDVEVWTRKVVHLPKTANAKPAAAPPSKAVQALAGILPKADLPMRVAVAPFVVPGTSKVTVSVALGLRRPAVTARLAEQVDLLIRAFTPDGDARGQADQPITVNLTPPRRGVELSRYDLLGRVDLKPGRYELRISAHSGSLDKHGSVYADVEVPDFAKAPLSLSGVVLSVLPGVSAAPLDALTEIVPVVPTTEREFTRIDRVSAFLRVYHGAKAPTAPVAVAIRILDAKGATAFEQAESLAPGRFAGRAADVKFAVPIGGLAPGAYLLTVEATLDKTVARRDVTFTIK